jgi:DNA polymerase-1
MSDNRLFLLDGHALVYRAHFAFVGRPLINSKGVNTSAVTGFVRTLWDLIRTEKPTHLAVAFDPPTPTFRHELMESYKANREEQPEDITIALPYIHQILQAFKIPILMVNGYEADDVIGTLAKQAESEGYMVYMVTPDKDFGQLVSDKVILYKPSRQGNGVEKMGPKEICDRWNIRRVDQVVDMLGLMGDSVDNIPGIPGIGEKTAAKLLQEFDSMENLLANTDKLKGKQRESIEQYAAQGRLSKQLAIIDTQVPVRFNAIDYNLDPFDREWLSEIFKELEFRSLAKEILGEESAPVLAQKPAISNSKQTSLFDEESALLPVETPAPVAHSVAHKHLTNTPHIYHLVDSDEKCANLIAKLQQCGVICFDTETTDIDATRAELVGFSFAVEAGEAWYVPISEDQQQAYRRITLFKPLLENPAIGKIGQNLKYDITVLKRHGVEVEGDVFDTMVMHYLLEPEMRHNMDFLAESYLAYQPISIETLIGKKGKDQLSMRDVVVEKVKDYAAEDADVTIQLYHHFWPKLEKQEGLTKLYASIEGPLVKVLSAMESEGIRIDTDYLQKYAVELGSEIALLEQKVWDTAGFSFNLGSPKQVGEALFEKLKLTYRGGKTKSGQYSTDEETLSDMAADSPVVSDILRHRMLTKLKSTYVDALPRMVNPHTGRIHSSFNQTIAATGRLSSNNPNLQNIPVRSPEGARIREAFIPRDDDHILLAVDYSQIELRLIAAISGDEGMLEAFKAEQDIHRATAARVFDIPYDEVSREQRYKAKTVNFSIIYGAGAQNLSRQLGIKRTEAKELIDNYFAKYPGLRRYMEHTVAEARERGYVSTLMGRRRYLRDIHSRNSLLRSNAERMAINTPIQGTAADMIKIAMISINHALRQGGFRTKMILQVHDELVFDAHKDEVARVQPVIEGLMKNAIPDLGVPILVETGEGKNWLEAH